MTKFSNTLIDGRSEFGHSPASLILLHALLRLLQGGFERIARFDQHLGLRKVVAGSANLGILQDVKCTRMAHVFARYGILKAGGNQQIGGNSQIVTENSGLKECLGDQLAAKERIGVLSSLFATPEPKSVETQSP